MPVISYDRLMNTGPGVYITMCLGAYMPYECRDNEDSYLENLGTLKKLLLMSYSVLPRFSKGQGAI